MNRRASLVVVPFSSFLLLGGCSSHASLDERTAPSKTTPPAKAAAPIDIRMGNESGGPATTTTPYPAAEAIVPALDTIPITALATSTITPQPTSAPNPAPSVPAPAPEPQRTTPPIPASKRNPAPTRVTAPPATQSATSPATTAPLAVAPTTTPPTQAPTTAPTQAPTPAPATEVATSSPATSTPATSSPTTIRPALIRGPFAVVATPCLRSQRDLERATRKGQTVRCTIVGKGQRWTLVAVTTTSLVPATSAPPIVPGFDGTTIRIGLLTTTTHPIWGGVGKAISAGIEARVAAINRAGGIGGRYKLVVVKGETNYDPTETLVQIQATKNSVVAYVSLLGTPSTEAAEPILRVEGILASPASQEARWASAPNLLPIFNSYQVQAINGIAYFSEQFQTSNPGIRPTVCGVSVATSFGEAGSEGIRSAAQTLPVSLGPIVSVAPTETAFAAAIGALKSAGCQATFVTVGPAQTLGLVLTGRQLAFSTRWIIMGAAFSDRIVTPQTGPLFEQGAWVVGDGTQWGDENVPGMVQMKAELIASDNRYWTENPDVGLSYGWAQARTMERVLEAAVARNDLSRGGVLSASQSVGTVDIGGIGSPTNYSQALRLANARTTIFNVDNSYRNAIKVLARDYGSPAAQNYRR